MDASPRISRGRIWAIIGRWHTSSRVVVALVLVILAICNLPGELVERTELDSWVTYTPRQFEHGWPLTHLRRSNVAFKWGDRWQTVRACWQLWADKPELHAGPLIVNLVFTIVVAALSGFAFEQWRRQRMRLWRVHLRDLLGLVVAVSVMLAWYVANRHEYLQEQAILRLHQRDDDRPSGLRQMYQWRGGSTWLRALAGDPLFTYLNRARCVAVDGDSFEDAARLKHVEIVEVVGPVNNEDLRQLVEFPSLRWLDLREAWFADRDKKSNPIVLPDLPQLRILILYGHDGPFAGLRRLRSLEALDLRQTTLDEATLNDVATLPRLRYLQLHGTNLNAYGIARLTTLTRLERLELDFFYLNDAAMCHLGKMKSLRVLAMNGAQFPSGSFAHLEGLTQLERLELGAASVDDAVFKSLPRLPQLRELMLSRVDISPAGIGQIKELKQLQLLELYRVALSQEHFDALRATNPNCEIRLIPSF